MTLNLRRRLVINLNEINALDKRNHISTAVIHTIDNLKATTPKLNWHTISVQRQGSIIREVQTPFILRKRAKQAINHACISIPINLPGSLLSPQTRKCPASPAKPRSATTAAAARVRQRNTGRWTYRTRAATYHCKQDTHTQRDAPLAASRNDTAKNDPKIVFSFLFSRSFYLFKTEQF